VLTSPEAWRDIPISFSVHFRQVAKNGASFFTRFESDQWLNFVGWADETALWDKKAFDADFKHLFIRRDSPDAKLVSAAATYDRFVLSCVVRDVIKGEPWIEVTAVRKLSERISEGSLVHIVKGLTLRDHRRFDAAAREFEAADADTLPKHVRMVTLREGAFALLNGKKPRAAEEKLVAALALDPENSETAVALAHVREEIKKAPPERPLVRELPQPNAEQPQEQDEEPILPGAPDPLADRPRQSRTVEQPQSGEPIVPGAPDPLAERPRPLRSKTVVLPPNAPRLPADSRPGQGGRSPAPQNPTAAGTKN
jgi:hypothetical protein